MSNEAKFLDTELFDHLTRIEAILEHENLTKTASLLAQQRQIVGDLYGALVPFAGLLQSHNSQGRDDQPIYGINDCTITRGHLRAAVAALARARGEV